MGISSHLRRKIEWLLSVQDDMPGTAFWGFWRKLKKLTLELATLHYTAIESASFIHSSFHLSLSLRTFLRCHYVCTMLIAYSAWNKTAIDVGDILLLRCATHTLWNCYFKSADVKNIFFSLKDRIKLLKCSTTNCRLLKYKAAIIFYNYLTYKWRPTLYYRFDNYIFNW